MLKYSHPVLAVLVHHWPSMVLLPSLLILIAALAMVTRRWDARDEAARRNAR
jgi:hypothetical protein